TLRDITGATVVVKLGPQGALLLGADGLLRAPVASSAPPVDVTGAGDSFSAAFLSARAHGLSDEEALQQAVLFSSRKVQFAGTQPLDMAPAP
ncbi:MAG TPA: PfkB family carbohydrate kinase, partial [Candidatus Cryosericum sp.]|nr:PfkB family carbohydrate kinase [Candidatus Cryosericum sp.]